MERYLHTGIPQTTTHLTVKPSSAAGDQDAAFSLGLHVRQESLDGLDGTKEVDLQDFSHGVQGLHLQGPHQPHASIAHCRE